MASSNDRLRVDIVRSSLKSLREERRKKVAIKFIHIVIEPRLGVPQTDLGRISHHVIGPRVSRGRCNLGLQNHIDKM